MKQSTRYLINLKAKSDFMKLSLSYTDVCLMQVFENPILRSPRGCDFGALLVAAFAVFALLLVTSVMRTRNSSRVPTFTL